MFGNFSTFDPFLCCLSYSSRDDDDVDDRNEDGDEAAVPEDFSVSFMNRFLIQT